ncbi:PhnE/PtxC family ABC transporter permease [[Eubacterium] hominis]|uniref:PhnE/PtxC family ABC transporter permease n=1 Tax=[Eubacterium] hominis TaxID=2764325 RepID=UPI003A4E321B
METSMTLQKQTSTLQRKKRGRYRIKQVDKTSRMILGILVVFAFVFLYFITVMCEYRWDQVRIDFILEILPKFVDFSQLSSSFWQSIGYSLINTVLLSVVTTLLGAMIGLFLGLGAARNLSHPFISNVIRAFAGFIRAVPTIIWAILFVSGFGLSATTAIVGMSFHSIAYFIKSYSEAFEEVEEGTLEAMRATGANWWQIVTSAILPSSFTKMISWVAMRSEMNFAAAVIIGPAVGVPGTIGSILNQCSRAGDYGGLGLCVLTIFLTALVFEVMITRYKQKTIVNAS